MKFRGVLSHGNGGAVSSAAGWSYSYSGDGPRESSVSLANCLLLGNAAVSGGGAARDG